VCGKGLAQLARVALGPAGMSSTVGDGLWQDGISLENIGRVLSNPAKLLEMGWA
jgi:hypothetical protein